MASTAQSTGAEEHGSMPIWTGAIAFANIGLVLKGFQRPKWHKTHAPRLQEQMEKLLLVDGLVGICLSEVGASHEVLGLPEKKLMQKVIRKALSETHRQAAELMFFWDGETMACFLMDTDIEVEELETLTNFMPDKWRRIARYKLQFAGAVEHGVMNPSFLLWNNHQPASPTYPWKHQSLAFGGAWQCRFHMRW